MNSSYARPVDFGRITSRSYHVFIDVFPHAETKKFLPFYVTLGRWEDATIFTIDVRIRTNEPADLHEFQVPIDLAVERADVNRINPG